LGEFVLELPGCGLSNAEPAAELEGGDGLLCVMWYMARNQVLSASLVLAENSSGRLTNRTPCGSVVCRTRSYCARIRGIVSAMYLSATGRSFSLRPVDPLYRLRAGFEVQCLQRSRLRHDRSQAAIA
jgi:hypothetical protein